MSDCIIKIIPLDPFSHIASHNMRQAVEFLKALFGNVSAVAHEKPVFVDCGENLERITCPFCGAEIDFGWWGEAVNAAYGTDFMSLEAEMPCCHRVSSLNDLDYYFPCGFACAEIDILNPATEPDDKCLAVVQVLLGERLRVIRSRL